VPIGQKTFPSRDNGERCPNKGVKVCADDSSYYRSGIDLGATNIEIALLGPDGNEALRWRIPTPQDYKQTIEAIAALVRDCEAQVGGSARVGIGIPGVISPATGLVKNAIYLLSGIVAT
jgi:predicted NBD/HSP70 family sugar kinase